MNCPRCLEQGRDARTEVLETRAEMRGDIGLRIRRRRRCSSCRYRFTSFETPHLGSVRKRDGQVERFNEIRLVASLAAANEQIGIDEKVLHGAVEGVRVEVEASSEPVDIRDVNSWLLDRLDAYPDLQEGYRKRARGDSTSGRVTKRGRRSPEPFDPNKLRKALRGTVHRRVSEETLEGLVRTIEERVVSADPKPVSTAEIREWVTEGLRQLDPFAYLRILSTTPGVDLRKLRQELIAVQNGLVRKRDGRFESFSREKLVESIRKATVKRETIAAPEVEEFAEKIGARVREEGDPVDSERIGGWVLEWLKEKDAVAFMSFLMVFRPPDSPRSLQRLLEDSELGAGP